MTSKELKRMGREELLQLLIDRTTEAEELRALLAQKEQEIMLLKEHPVADVETLTVQEPGSIAQAAMEMNHVFEAAQKAADQYLSTIARMQREQALRCQQLLSEAQAEADRRIAEAQQRAEAMETETARQCSELRRIAEQAAQHNWSELNSRLDQLCDDSAKIHSLLASDNKKRNGHR